MYPGADVHTNYILNTPSGEYYELDIYIPSQKLAIEYQGEQHFDESAFFGDHKVRQVPICMLYFLSFRKRMKRNILRAQN